MARSSEQRKKQKANKAETTLKFPHTQRGWGQARHNRSPGKAGWGQLCWQAHKKKKEIVRYHPPRGKP